MLESNFWKHRFRKTKQHHESCTTIWPPETPKQVSHSQSTALSTLNWIYIQIFLALILNSSSSFLSHLVRKRDICERKLLVQNLVLRRHYENTKRNSWAILSSTGFHKVETWGCLSPFILVISNKQCQSFITKTLCREGLS